MKLASLKSSSRDGRLVVVSRDLTRCLPVPGIAPTLQAALDDWASLAPQLFHPGANQLTAYAISGPADRPVLDPIPIDRGGSPSAP